MLFDSSAAKARCYEANSSVVMIFRVRRVRRVGYEYRLVGLNGRSTGAVLRAAMLRSLADQPDGPQAGSIPN